MNTSSTTPTASTIRISKKACQGLRQIAAAACLAWLSCVTVLHAQADTRLAGRVVDQTGLALPGVSVELRTSPDEPPRMTTTDVNGEYEFDGVTPGGAEVIFRAINFAVSRREVTPVTGRDLTVDATLSLSLIADVTVTGGRTFRDVADLENPAENLVGVAMSASQGAITARQLAARPIMRAGEVLETVPGVIISQHSGQGKANQYYLRGFNLDHGTDFSTTVAGVPVNMPTHGHGHGYSDVNFLMPELVSGVQFKKGPYYADEGDFSAAGAANINYVNTLDRPMARVSAGGDGWRRLFAAASPQLGGGHLLAAVEVNHNDGPWVRPDDFQKVNAVLRYSRGDAQNAWSVTGMGYSAGWDATDQIPERAVQTRLISRFGNLDPSDGGDTHRYSLSADYQRARVNSVTRATAFVLDYGLNLFSNFTYFLDDPVNGDQFEQVDRRIVSGGRVTHRRLGRWMGRHVESAVGMQVRHDAIGEVGLHRTEARRRLSTVRSDIVHQTSGGLFAQTEIEWSPVFRTVVGLRGDVYRFDVEAGNPANSGTETAGLISPKLSATFGPWSGTELYVNAGLGFHSNDARGAAITVDPASGKAVDRVTPLVRARGAEIGMRSVRIPGVQSTVSLWTLGLDSELLFVGDAGTTEASRPTRRYGVEWTNYVKLAPWLIVDADLSLSHARFTDDDPAGDRIPGALDRVVSAGITVEPARRLFGSVRLRHFGPRPLIEDGSVRSESTTVVYGEAGYRLSDHLRLMLDVFNLFDSEVSDVDYFYTSRLPGEPSAGVDDIHTHPTLPRTVRVTVQVGF